MESAAFPEIAYDVGFKSLTQSIAASNVSSDDRRATSARVFRQASAQAKPPDG
jgi:hypothetical protein